MVGSARGTRGVRALVLEAVVVATAPADGNGGWQGTGGVPHAPAQGHLEVCDPRTGSQMRSSISVSPGRNRGQPFMEGNYM